MDSIKCHAIRCRKCGKVIESTYAHDFKWCSCGAIAVDGGQDYLWRCGNMEGWDEVSEIARNPAD